MKAFALAVVAAAGLLCSAGTADAQWRSRGSYASTYPSYHYSYGSPTYTYPMSTYPTSNYAPPTFHDNPVVVTSGYAPAYSPMVYPSGNYYPSTFNGSYSNSSSYYGSGFYPSGGYMGDRRGWRW